MSMSWLFGSKEAQSSPTTSATTQPEASTSACPLDHSTRNRWLQGQKASDDASNPFYSQKPSTASSSASVPGKAVSMPRSLSQERETSSIPRFSEPSSPATEARADKKTSSNWVYPSPSQFFTALQRKNRPASEADMDTVVTIHNAVNERTWREVMQWEKEAGEEVQPQLVSFKGRPQDRSPRAWWKVLLGYQPPFDRHDWIVDRHGKRIRYVIDFYTGRGGANASLPAGVPPQLAFYLDVRPALDDFESIKMRVRRNFNKLFGLTSLDKKQSSGSQ